MKFTQEINPDSYYINAHDDQSISINGEVYQQSLIILPDEIIADWGVKSVDQLSLDKLSKIQTSEVDVILLSTGLTHRIPDMKIMAHYLEQGTGCEVMSTAAACRTFNLLVSEGRQVAACLMIETA